MVWFLPISSIVPSESWLIRCLAELFAEVLLSICLGFSSFLMPDCLLAVYRKTRIFGAWRLILNLGFLGRSINGKGIIPLAGILKFPARGLAFGKANNEHSKVPFCAFDNLLFFIVELVFRIYCPVALSIFFLFAIPMFLNDFISHSNGQYFDELHEGFMNFA